MPGGSPERWRGNLSGGDVAQSVEHRLCKAGVAGSNPVVSTVLKRRFALALSSSVIGLATFACQKSIAQDPPCPPGEICEDPIDLWPTLAPVGGGMLAIGLAIGLALLPRNDQPALVPETRSLRVALGLALVAALILAVSPQLPLLFGWLQWGALVGACLLGGTALRPRGSRYRGLMLGGVAYLVGGVVSVLITNRGFVGDMDLLAWLVQVLAWPGLMFLRFGQFLG